MSKEYLVQPEQYGERKADYKKGKIINTKWKPISSKESFEKFPSGFCGNVHHQTVVNTKTKKVEFSAEDVPWSDKTRSRLSQTISAALALYRIICMIENPIVETQGAAGYKVPWSVNLIHVETGEILSFSEWKGAFGIWTRFHDQKELPEAYKRDIIEILNLMFSNKSPHPYDGCTAGIVA